MANRTTLLLLLLVLCHGVAITMGLVEYDEDRRGTEREERPSRSSESSLFMMHSTKSVVKTDAGEMRVLKSYSGRILERRLHIGFITMEPQSLLIPQYLDSNLIIFIRRGEAKLGFIYKDNLAERRLKAGEVYVIPAGSPFYLVNVWRGQRLHIICSIDHSESLEPDTFRSFYIGGGANLESVLSGFGPEVLRAAFNASRTEVRTLFTGRLQGPIVYVNDSRAPSLWTKFLQLKNEDKMQHLKKMVQLDQEEVGEEEEKQQTSWSWRKLLETMIGKENKKKDYKGTGGSPDSYNLYGSKPDFRNNYGWSKAVDGHKYPPLIKAGVGIYHVNLTAGPMMAPHVNPRATEYGIVLRGAGRIEVVFPNGTNAMNTEIKEGDVFYVPRYFPFCQIASRSGPLEFFGFTTSSRTNRPQFLVGAASLIRTMMGPELAAAFGVSEDTMWRMAHAQHDSVILPSASAAPGDAERKEPKGFKSLARDMVMDVLDDSF